MKPYPAVRRLLRRIVRHIRLRRALRRLARHLWLAALLPLAACAVSQLRQSELAPRITMSEETAAFLRELDQRVVGNVDLPNMEILLCVYGTIHGDTIAVESFQATTLMDRDSVHLAYAPCTGRHMLGTWHTHPVLVGYASCEFSVDDMKSFHDTKAIITIISCDNGERFVSMVKHGYSRMWKP